MRVVVASLIVIACSAGCSLESPGDGELDHEAGASIVSNGQNLNGQNLNGQNLNGQNLNGQNLNGSALGSAIAWVELDSGYAGPAPLVGETIVGSELRAAGRSGAGFTGVTFAAASDTGVDLALRIAEARPPAAGSDAWSYRVEYQETNGAWYPICLDPSSGFPTTAYALRGYWDRGQGVPGGGAKIADPEVFTFACARSGNLGKCVEMGYRPWATVAGQSLDERHQACVRLMRNDYCGDGTAHTVDGNLINVYDALGIQSDAANWLAEAEWDADGARCLTVNNRAPLSLTCRGSLMVLSLGCGARSHFDSGALMITERPLLGGGVLGL